MNNRLVIIVPCYNEEAVFEDSNHKLVSLIKDLVKKRKVSSDSFILYVNDGSSDNTWNLIQKENKENKYVCGLSLARNVGHQNALLAGVFETMEIVDMSITIDADLQDDISVIEEMIGKYSNGTDIVYGVRNDRKIDGFFKRITALGFYKFMSFMGVDSIYNHADFRLMSKRSMIALSNYKERNMFLRGIVPLLGYKTDCVYYARKKRLYGESKYSLKKMLYLAFDGITSFSIKPMTIICFFGIVIIFISIIAMIYGVIGYFNGESIGGWSSLFCSIWFLGGVQLLSIGIIGQYIGKIYVEVKERPRYSVEKKLMGKMKESKGSK